MKQKLLDPLFQIIALCKVKGEKKRREVGKGEKKREFKEVNEKGTKSEREGNGLVNEK